MKMWKFVLIVIATVIVATSVASSALGLFFGFTEGGNAQIEIDSYRLCEDKNGEDVIIIKYLLKNKGEEPTALFYEGDFYVYQNGIGLTEYTAYDEDADEELPEECHYDPEDQFRNIKGGAEYYAEIAYRLEDPDADVEVEVDDYGLLDGKREKVFQIK